MASTRRKTIEKPAVRSSSLPSERIAFQTLWRSWAGFRFYPNWPHGEPPPQDGTVQVGWEYDCDAEPTPAQHAAYAYIEENERAVTASVLRCIVGEYAEQTRAYEEGVSGRRGRPALPEVTDVHGLRAAIGAPAVYLLEGQREGIGYLGLVFPCAWERRRHLALVTHRTRVVEIGRNGSSLAVPWEGAVDNPNDAVLLVAQADELCRGRRYAEAEACLRAALVKDPALPLAHNNMGWVRQMQGDPAAAVAAYGRALAIDGSFGRARRNLAALLARLGHFPEALELRRAEALARPDELPAIEAVISAALLAGDLELAGEQAGRYARLCHGSRWYPVARQDNPEPPHALAPPPLLTPGKLAHDLEQLQFLRRRGVLDGELTAVIAEYAQVLEGLSPLGEGARVPLDGEARERIGHVYNRIVHLRTTPRVTRALSGKWDPATAEDDYLARRPNVAVVDRFLTDEALESLRLFCLESTIWSTNRYEHGRLGSFFRDGFNCPLLLQIAEELRDALPRLLGPRVPLRQVWGFKYASLQPELSPHADFAAVNVNLWITPDDANLDASTGGLLLYDVTAPLDWDFEAYNRGGRRIQDLLTVRSAHPTRIPYRCNRAVIFDSDLFHTTQELTFASGYENRRINVTFLYGDRRDRCTAPR